MNLFSLYRPGTSLFHRMGVGGKYLVLLVLTMPALVLGSPVASVLSLAVAMALLASCRIGLRTAWGLPGALWVLIAVMAAYQLILGRADLAVVVSVNLVTAVFASRLLTATTPGPVLIDALVTFLGPFRRIGVNPDAVGLAIAVMLRSVPVLSLIHI